MCSEDKGAATWSKFVVHHGSSFSLLISLSWFLKRIKVKVDGPVQNKPAIGDGAKLIDYQKQDDKLRY